MSSKAVGSIERQKTGRGATKSRVGRKPWVTIGILLAPAVVYYLIFILYPLVATVVTSFTYTSARGAGLLHEFVGLQHYRNALSDWMFHLAIRNTLIWAVVGTTLEVLSALIVALFIYFKVPFKEFYRFAWFTPVLLGGVIVAVIWKWVLNPSWGVFNIALETVGLGTLTTDWLGNPGTVLASIIGIHVWNRFGYYMIIILAGLSSVPNEIIDCASIDGANRFQTSRKIVLPMIMPVFGTAAVISFLGKMRAFNLVWVLTRGGPMHMSETVATYVHKRAFTWPTPEFGYPATVAVMWFGVVFILYFVVKQLMRSRA